MHHHRDLAGQSIFELVQESVLATSDREEANLGYLAGLCFQLSMDRVSTLAPDLTKLKALGFHSLKVRTDTLM